MPCSEQEERMPGRDEEKDAKASWNRASTDTLSSRGARLLSFPHHDATHMQTQSPRIRVYDATHPRKHQSMQFSYRLYNRYHPSWHVICQPRNHPSMVMRPSQRISYHPSTNSSMVRHLRHMYLIIRPQVIHGQAHSPNCYLSSIHKSSVVQGTLLPHVAYQPPQIIYGSGTLLRLVSFSSIHKSSMVRAPLLYLFLSSIHKSSTVQSPSFHPLLIIIHKSSNGSGTLVFCLFLIIHPRVIYGSFHPRCLLIIHPFHPFSSSSSSLPLFSAILSFPGTDRTHTHTQPQKLGSETAFFNGAKQWAVY